jgi:hypothetical protein
MLVLLVAVALLAALLHSCCQVPLLLAPLVAVVLPHPLQQHQSAPTPGPSTLLCPAAADAYPRLLMPPAMLAGLLQSCCQAHLLSAPLVAVAQPRPLQQH